MLQTFFLLATLLVLSLLIARRLKSVKVFTNLVLAIAIGMIIGSNYNRMVEATNVVDTKCTVIDEVVESQMFDNLVDVMATPATTQQTVVTAITINSMVKKLATSIINNSIQLSYPDKGKPLLQCPYQDTS